MWDFLISSFVRSPRIPSHCPIGMSSDKHIVISSALSSDHKFFCRGRLTWYRFCQVRKMIYDYQYLVIFRVCHADLLMVYLHDLAKFRAFLRLKSEFHFFRILLMYLWSIEYVFNHLSALLSTCNLNGLLPRYFLYFSTKVTIANISAWGAPYFISVSLKALLP